jgi:hypothetical protein
MSVFERLRRVPVGATGRPGVPAVLTLFGALVACSPALDWREVRPDGSDAIVLMPCKPASHARRVELAGTELTWTLHACQAMGMTWGFGFAALDDPARVDDVLRELQRSALSHIGASDGDALPLKVDGATPNAQAARRSAQGRLPDGRAVQQQVAFFVRGTRVYQASVVGTVVLAEEAQTFFDGLSLR